MAGRSATTTKVGFSGAADATFAKVQRRLPAAADIHRPRKKIDRMP
jgi:hypothetical protein